MRNVVKNNWPILCLAALNLALFITNYKPGTFLTGWDNLHTEFWPEMNIKRAIFAVWQEYQSLGLLGGMGHASDIVRQLYVWLLTFIFPLPLVRYVSTFTMLFLGGVGMYLFTNYILSKRTARPLASELNAGTDKNSDLPYTGIGRRSLSEGRDSHESKKKLAERHLATWVSGEQMLSFLASLFYTLNIGTIQTFYAPFEAFIYHFAALPWLLFASILFLEKSSFKRLLFLIIVLLASTPASYIPTLFVVYILAMLIYVIVNFVLSTDRISFLLRSAKLSLIIFAVNAFWLLPFLYFTFNNSHININSKINQMATEQIYEQNREFGTLLDTALLKGFWFNNIDPNLEGDFDYMFEPWRQHFSNKIVVATGLLVFGTILIGVIATLKRALYPLANELNADTDNTLGFFPSRISRRSLSEGREKLSNQKRGLPSVMSNVEWRASSIAFVFLFFFAFTMLVTDTAPFSWFDELFRKIPLFGQAFRFPFTKFSSLATLTYSIMLALGISYIVQRIKNYELGIMRFIHYSLFIIPTSLIIFVAFPAFRGHLFYDKNRIAIPKEYFDTFEFFREQDLNARIANFPQPTFWGWTFYRWGYGGSGFIWYGIKQPILDRAFDVWSDTGENYYYELTSALYSQNIKALERVLNKYQITWLLLDRNVIYPLSPKSLFYERTEDILAKIPGIRGAAQFGNIKIYKFEAKDKPQSFISTTSSNLPPIDIPFWKTSDQAYSTFGNYISVNCSPRSAGEAGQLSIVTCQLYPFGSLFSQKTAFERDFRLSNLEATLLLEKEMNLAVPSTMSISPLFESEKIVAFSIYKMADSKGNTVLSALLSTPQIQIDSEKVYGQSLEVPLFIIPKNSSYPVTLNINGISNITLISGAGDEKTLAGTSFLTAREKNQVILTGHGLSRAQTIPESIFESLFARAPTRIAVPQGEHTLTVLIPKINDSYLSYEGEGQDAQNRQCNSSRAGIVETSLNNQALTIKSADASVCLSLYSQTLPHDEAYAVFLKSKNILGRPLHFWILNEDQNNSPIDTYLPRRPASEKLQQGESEASFILPPQEANGRAYSFHLDNISIGRKISENTFSMLAAYPLPWRFITNISLASQEAVTKESREPAKIESIYHPNESLFILRLAESSNPTTLVLSQSYNPGWKAYKVKNHESRQGRGSPLVARIMNYASLALPFIFGSEIKDHVKVNSWENGWLLPNETIEQSNNQTIIIVYLPQYLEYAGLALILVGGLGMAASIVIRHSNRVKNTT